MFKSTMIGKILNSRYKITEKIGTGGMANVYRGTDETLGRTVAIKVMHPQYSTDPAFAKRFKSEAAAAANLQNPHIVQIYDWGFDNDSNSYFIAMEFVHGADLKSIIRSKGPLLPGQTARIASQVAQALAAAHAYGIIHRDIKPHNIIITSDGNVKVMDFGIAYFGGDNNLTQDGTVLGSAYYVSPEQAKGKQLTDASDLYSLGIVMYEAATGKLPFTGDDAVSVALKQINDTPVEPAVLNPNIDLEFDGIISKAMQKDPKQRFGSAKDMGKALDSYLNNRIGNAKAAYTSAAAVIETDSNERDKTTLMPAVPVDAGIASSRPGTASYRSSRSLRSEDKATTKTNSSTKKRRIIIIAAIGVVVVGLLVWLLTSLDSCSGGNVRVPHVIGATESDAISQIEKAGLVSDKIEYKASATVPQGNVVSQDPQPDTRVASGSKVNLVVSSGKDPAKKTSVPNLLGLTASEAEAALLAANLKFIFGQDEFSDTIESGKVTTQSPKAGESVDEGTKVTYNISKGKQTISVPFVEGMTETEAKRILTEAGLGVNVTYASDNNSSIAVGSVISQNKVGGNYKEGEVVTITVKQSNDATVPNLQTGSYTVAQARTVAQNAGFLGVSAPGMSETQLVKRQSPAPGTTQNKNSYISVYPS